MKKQVNYFKITVITTINIVGYNNLRLKEEIDLENWIEELETALNNIDLSELILQLIVVLIQLIAVWISFKLLFRFTNFLIDSIFKKQKTNSRYLKQRNKTLKIVLKSGVRYTLYFLAVTMALEIMGIPTTSILAGAGVLGLAVGFGAQSLVTDVITGFFILFEKQFAVGDYIRTAGVEGIVDEIGLRVTKIKNFDGDLHIIPNGNIKQVTNLTANARRVLVDVPIDYDESITRLLVSWRSYVLI